MPESLLRGVLDAEREQQNRAVGQARNEASSGQTEVEDPSTPVAQGRKGTSSGQNEVADPSTPEAELQPAAGDAIETRDESADDQLPH